MRHDILCGDCLDVLKAQDFPAFDLVYLDPPFCTQKKHALTTRDGNQKFQYSDLWATKADYSKFIHERLTAFRKALKETGSLFFHCDATASHLARLALDDVFGEENFISEIIWSYRRWTNSQKSPTPSHQTIFFYSKTPSYKFNQLFSDYSETTNADQILQKRVRDDRNKSVYATDDNGEVIGNGAKKGVPISDVWDIPFLNPKATERVGYPTQKPILLLERIIELVTDPGDWILDPFCGSGTTVVAAKLNDRNAIGIDVLPDAVELSRSRVATPQKTASKLLLNGRSSYLPKDELIHQMLMGIDYVPVARNKGLDAILKADVYGRPVFVRVQRDDESISDAARAICKAASAKGNPLLIVIKTADRTTGLWDEEGIPGHVHVVHSMAFAVEGRLREFVATHNPSISGTIVPLTRRTG